MKSSNSEQNKNVKRLHKGEGHLMSTKGKQISEVYDQIHNKSLTSSIVIWIILYMTDIIIYQIFYFPIFVLMWYIHNT